jgi:Uma2 family endonuclease
MATEIVTGDSLQAIAEELRPVVDHLVTEDDTPVDNLFSEKQMRLLTEPLYSSWAGPGGQRPFVAMANVGLFYSIRRPPLVPDMLLSLDVDFPADVHLKHNRSYFVWEYGKPPDVVVEVVSNREGGEDSDKLATYARIPIRYYVIYDPDQLLSAETLRIWELGATGFRRLEGPAWFPDAGLGLSIWQGRYENMDATWLRWVDASDKLVPTGRELAEAERERADIERQRADSLAEQLRQHGIEPLGR